MRWQPAKKDVPPVTVEGKPVLYYRAVLMYTPVAARTSPLPTARPSQARSASIFNQSKVVVGVDVGLDVGLDVSAGGFDQYFRFTSGSHGLTQPDYRAVV